VPTSGGTGAAVSLGDGREALILGAGFSRAISEHMPLTDELGQMLAVAGPEVFTGLSPGRSFERWLSHRAEPQPYLSASENLKRQAVFAQATVEIAKQVDAAIARALTEPLKSWLGTLIALWHLHECDVVTFNYDTLVECAVESLDFWDWRQGGRVQWGSLLNYNPPGMAGSSWDEWDGSGAPYPTFRLWKLHGSVNWYWSPGDPSGASALRIRLPGVFGAPEPLGIDEAHWRAPGRERLLVPPSSLKSPYYANPVSREVWARASEGLADADVVTLIGYSLPVTDLTTAGMLTEAMAAGRVREVRIVDVEPAPIAGRVRALAPDHVSVVAFDGGENPVEVYVDQRLREAARRAVEQVCGALMHPGAGVVVTWGDLTLTRGTLHRTALVLSARREAGSATVDVQAGELADFESEIARWETQPPACLSRTELQLLLDDAERIRVRLGDDPRAYTVIAAAPREVSTGRGNETWLQLIPAEPPPGPVASRIVV